MFTTNFHNFAHLWIVVDLWNQLGIENLNAQDINEAIEFDDKELTNEEIYGIKS